MKPKIVIILAMLILLTLAGLLAGFFEFSYGEGARNVSKEQLSSLSQGLLAQIIQADGILIGFTGALLTLTPRKNSHHLSIESSYVGFFTIVLFIFSLILSFFGYISTSIHPSFTLQLFKLPFTGAMSFFIAGVTSMLTFLILVRVHSERA